VFTVLVGNNFCPVLDKFDIIIVPQFYKFLRIPVLKVNSFEMFSLLQEWFSADLKEEAESTASQNNENFPSHVYKLRLYVLQNFMLIAVTDCTN